MKGAIIGDIVGSAYEFNNILTKDFPLFSKSSYCTDDTVMTCAVAKALLEYVKHGGELSDLTVKYMQRLGRMYPNCGFGGMFEKWVHSNNPAPYNSFGNGSAMRISAVGLYADSLVEARRLARQVTVVTHNHPEGIRGAQAVACAMVVAKQGGTKQSIKAFVERNFFYDLGKSVEYYREQSYGHGAETCQVSLPQAFTCFLEGENYEDVIRNCVSIGGDCDTVGAIAGALAECYYGVPTRLEKKMDEYLPKPLREIKDEFYKLIKNR